jgi:hypothetical protein
MINNADAYAKCKNCDRINGNYSGKGTNNDKNKVSTTSTASHINSKHIAQKDMKKITLQDSVDLS